MGFFLKYSTFGSEKFVPIGDVGNQGNAIEELKTTLYKKIIHNNLDGEFYLVKREIAENRVMLWQAPLRIKEKKDKIIIRLTGKYEPDDHTKRALLNNQQRKQNI